MCVRRHINWNNQRSDLKEDLAHLVQHIKRRICGIASAGLPWFSVWSFHVVLKWLGHARSRHLRAWGCWYSRGSVDGCSDRRTPRSVPPGLPGRSSFPAGCGSSRSGAIARSCPVFVGDMALPWRVLFSCRPAIQPVHRRRSWTRCPTTVEVCEQHMGLITTRCL